MGCGPSRAQRGACPCLGAAVAAVAAVAAAAWGCHLGLTLTEEARQAEGWTAWWTEVSGWVDVWVEAEEEVAWAAL